MRRADLAVQPAARVPSAARALERVDRRAPRRRERARDQRVRSRPREGSGSRRAHCGQGARALRATSPWCWTRIHLAGSRAEIPDAGETAAERLQRTAHFARVGIWDLKTNEPVLKLRAEAGGTFVPVGKRPVDDPLVNAAQQRQVNSCALALEVKSALAPKSEAEPKRAGPEGGVPAPAAP